MLSLRSHRPKAVQDSYKDSSHEQMTCLSPTFPATFETQHHSILDNLETWEQNIESLFGPIWNAIYLPVQSQKTWITCRRVCTSWKHRSSVWSCLRVCFLEEHFDPFGDPSVMQLAQVSCLASQQPCRESGSSEHHSWATLSLENPTESIPRGERLWICRSPWAQSVAKKGDTPPG